MTKKIFRVLAFFLLGLGGGLASQFLFPYIFKTSLVSIVRKEEVRIEENTALQNAVDKMGNTIVGIKTKLGTGSLIQGTGLILSSDGLILTLADLIPQGNIFSIFLNDKEETRYQVLKRDFKNNLALIKIEEKDLPSAPFADFEKIKLGERVFLIGAVFDKGKLTKEVNEGVIKGITDSYLKTNMQESYLLEGSPLFNIEGKLLGLNYINEKGMVLSIPVSKIREFTGF